MLVAVNATILPTVVNIFQVHAITSIRQSLG